MADVVDAVAVRASALYRHFASKEQMLDQVVGDALAAVRTDVQDMTSTGVLAATALEQSDRRALAT